MVELAIIYDKVRFEEKALYEKAQKKNIRAQIVDGKSISVTTDSTKKDLGLGDVIMQRSVSHYRGLYMTACLEFLGYPVINKFQVGETCGNKLLTSLVLAKNGIPTPKTQFSFSSESAMESIRKSGFPLVLKPIVGSWGRGVFPLRDEEVASMVVEMREEDDSPFARIYYVQEMIDRPPRDIRCIVVGDQAVTAIYRYSAENEWRTNVARGGRAELADTSGELGELAIRAAQAVGGGIVGVDMMEDKERGLIVHEVNNTVEFHGAASVSEADIPGAMLDYAVAVAKK